VKLNKLKVFLSETSNDVNKDRDFLFNVLRKAELEVVTLDNSVSGDFALFQRKLYSTIEKTDCSIHIIGNRYDKLDAAENSLSEIQLFTAKKHSEKQQEEYRIFIWQPQKFLFEHADAKQEQFITSIRNNILHNITISNQESAVSFVEDIYAVMNTQTQTAQQGNLCDLFFIYNELDEDFAHEILDLLSDILKVEKLAMVQNSSRDYSNFIVEQSKRSKMVVVFFNWSVQWVLPFLQQLWRLMGGASASVPILAIADSVQKEPFEKVLTMPNVSALFVAQELIPLEIKVQFDRITKQ